MATGAVGPSVVVILDPNSRLFDDVSVSDSDISILSDPFSEGSDEVKKAAIHLVDQDVCDVFEFSTTFREIAKKCGADSNKSIASLMAETPEQIRARTVFTQIKKKVPLMAQMKVVSILNDRSIRFSSDRNNADDDMSAFVPDDKKTWEDIKDEIISSRQMLRNIKRLTEREKSRKILMAQAENEAYETMSNYWKLLSDYKDFRISPPGYNAYAGPEKHWLETESTSWDIMEKARAKVIYWLNKQCHI